MKISGELCRRLKKSSSWLTAALCSMTAFSAMAETKEWQFKVYLDDSEIGFHNFYVKQNGDQLQMSTQADFNVKLLFVTVYEYRHDNTESWNGNCLSSIDATTDDNGDKLIVRGSRQDEKFIVNTHQAESQLSGCVMTFAYWNHDFLKQERLLNSQTGKYEQVSVEFLGNELFEVNGTQIDSNVYELKGENEPIKLWYSTQDRQWLALESITDGGRVLSYRPR